MMSPISVATTGYIPMTPLSVMADGYLSIAASTHPLSNSSSPSMSSARLRKLNRVEEGRRITAARMAALLAASEW